MSEIFTNERELLQGVKNLDENFRNNMTNILKDSKSGGLSLDGDIRNGLYKGNDIQRDNVALSCQNLVAYLFSLNVSVKNDRLSTRGDTKAWERGQQFLDDLAEQSKNPTADNAFYVKFRETDVLAVRLTYAPYGSQATNGVDGRTKTSCPASRSARSYAKRKTSKQLGI